jgi:molybdopterin molybdotransferase
MTSSFTRAIMPLMKIVTPYKAQNLIQKSVQSSRIRAIPIGECQAMILAESIFADRDQPATDHSAMDGIAISFTAWAKGQRTFSIDGMQQAGIAQKTLKRSDNCFEIMTGAVIPRYCDCVVPIEQIIIHKGQAIVDSVGKLSRWQFIRRQGSEYKKGTLLISPNTKINSTHIAVAAAVGKLTVKVFSPEIAIVGTGDELVAIEKIPKSYQVRQSNAMALKAICEARGFSNLTLFHLNDNRAALKKSMRRIISTYDVIILSGGVSMGKFDFVPEVLNDLGAKTVFHKVNQKPGHPLLFARTQKGKAIFGLPGNPVSTMISAVRYVIPYLYKSCGLDINPTLVKLSIAVKQHPTLTVFLPVTIKTNHIAMPIRFAGSGDYGALTQSDGFVEIPHGQKSLKQGTGVNFYSW